MLQGSVIRCGTTLRLCCTQHAPRRAPFRIECAHELLRCLYLACTHGCGARCAHELRSVCAHELQAIANISYTFIILVTMVLGLVLMALDFNVRAINSTRSS